VSLVFSRILFPTDFSEHAKKALECIAGFPDVKEVILLHVVDTSRPGFARWGIEMVKEQARKQLQSECETLRAQGISARAVLKEIPHGPVGEMVIAVAREEAPSLILVGARGKGILRDILLGSVSSYVLRYSPSNVLIMKHRIVEGLKGRAFEKFCPRILSRVLCPTDFSPPARQALATIAPLKGLSEVILLHVIESGENEEEIAIQEKEAIREMERDTLFLSGRRIRSRYIVKVGSPSREIALCADEEDVSLVALSSHGRGWLGGIIPGSTAQEVAKIAARPVLVVRETGTKTHKVPGDISVAAS